MENGNQASQDPKSSLGEYLNRMSASMGPLTTSAKVTFNKSAFYTPTKSSTKFFAEPPPPNTTEPTAPKRSHFVFKKKNSKVSLNLITKPETPKPYSNGQGANQPSPYSIKAKDITQLKATEDHFRKVSASNIDFDPDQKRNSGNQNQTFTKESLFAEANRKNNKDHEGNNTFSGTLKIMRPPESVQGSSRLPNVTENTSLNTDEMPPMNVMSRFHQQKPVINTTPSFMQYTDFLKGGKFTSPAQEKNEVLIKAYATPQHQKKRPVSSNQNLISKSKVNEKPVIQETIPKDSPNNMIRSAVFAKNMPNDSVKYSYKFTTSDETFEIPALKDNFTQLLTEYNMKAYDEQLSEIKSTLKSMNFGKPAHAKKESKSLARIKDALYDVSHAQEQPHQEQKGLNIPQKIEEYKGISPRKARDKKKLQGEQAVRQESIKEEEKGASKAFIRPKPIVAERCRTSMNLRNNGEDSAGLPSQPNSAGQILFNKQIRDAKMMQSRLRRQPAADESQETHSISAYEASRQAPFQYYITNLRRYWKHYDEGNPFCRIYRDHFYQMFKEMRACKNIKNIDPAILARKRVYLPKKESHKDKKTLIFDLDETLIHCNPTLDIPSDVVLPIRFDDGTIVKAGINIRPYAIECLKEMSKYYEIIIFTASQSCYANVILDYLDPKNEYIHHRLFRESCIGTKEGVTVKDLRIMKDRNLHEIVIVDNSGNSMGCQIDNGIPIIPFHHNKNDTELLDLMDYLKSIQFENDLRVPNKNTFRLQDYAKYGSPKEVLDKVIMTN